MPFPTRSALVCAAILALLGGCTKTRTPAAPAQPRPSTAPSHIAEGTTAEQPTPRAALPSTPAPPPPASEGESSPTLASDGDVTRRAAGEYAPGHPAAAVGPQVPQPASRPELDYADLLAVASGYVAARLTYRFDDPAGYTAALTAPAFTTAAFAARSTPSAAALARLATAQETSTVQAGAAELAGEAPNSDSTRYVVVPCTVTTAYRGGSDTTSAAWTVRLLQAPPGQWRVDGVLSTD